MFPHFVEFKDALPMHVCESTQMIYGDNFLLDVSMVATLKALFHDRVPKGEYLEFRLSRLPKINWVGDMDAGLYVATTIPRDSCLTLCYIEGSNSDRDEDVVRYAEAFNEMVPGYSPVISADKFMDKSFLARCFSNEARKSGVIFIGQMDLRRFHYIQVVTPAVLHWYGVLGRGVTKEKLDVLRSLLNDASSDKYLDALGKEFENISDETKA